MASPCLGLPIGDLPLDPIYEILSGKMLRYMVP